MGAMESSTIRMAPAIPTWRDVGMRTGEQVDEATALRSFDAYFVGEMLKRAAPTENSEDSLFDGGSAGRMYRDYLNEELARIVAAHTDFGMRTLLEGKLQVRTDRPTSSEDPKSMNDGGDET